jgi:hypothetical protein
MCGSPAVSADSKTNTRRKASQLIGKPFSFRWESHLAGCEIEAGSRQVLCVDDTLLIEGAATRSRSVNRETFKADYDNTVRGREEWNYMNEISETIQVNTGYLTEEESSRMKYLLDSTDVFIQDLDNPPVIVPAIIATDTYSFHTINRAGVRMKNHTFDVKVAQNEYRR